MYLLIFNFFLLQSNLNFIYHSIYQSIIKNKNLSLSSPFFLSLFQRGEKSEAVIKF